MTKDQAQALEFYNSRIEAAINEDFEHAKEHDSKAKKRAFEKSTMGDVLNAITAIDNTLDAELFYHGYVETIRLVNKSTEQEASRIAKENIGYCFGNGMEEERKRMWVKACGAYHPVFGFATPSSQEALEVGMKEGRKRRQKEQN